MFGSSGDQAPSQLSLLPFPLIVSDPMASDQMAAPMWAMQGPLPQDLALEIIEAWEAELKKMQYDKADCVAVWIKGVLAQETMGVGAVDADLTTWARAVHAAWPDPGPPEDIPRIQEALGPRNELEDKMRRMIASVRRSAGFPSL